ncbi:hypothetical protein BgiBS90_005540, partial [Biomphalaria glabrata]
MGLTIGNSHSFSAQHSGLFPKSVKSPSLLPGVDVTKAISLYASSLFHWKTWALSVTFRRPLEDMGLVCHLPASIGRHGPCLSPSGVHWKTWALSVTFRRPLEDMGLVCHLPASIGRHGPCLSPSGVHWKTWALSVTFRRPFEDMGLVCHLPA